jgi:hypothetical protein
MSDGFVTSAQADQLLLDHAAACGITHVRGEPLTGRRLKRFRTAGVMPPRERRGAGRGPGMLVRDPPISKPQLVWVCQQLERSRSFRRAQVFLWYSGLWAPPGAIRDLVLEVYRRHQNLRTSNDQDVIADIAYEEARASITRDDRAEADRLAASWKPPDEGATMRPREVLVHARTQLNQATHGLDTAGMDTRLLTTMHRFDDFDGLDGAPLGYSEREVAPRVLHSVSDEHIIDIVSSLSEDDLAGIRWCLQRWWRYVVSMRHASMPPEYRDWANAARLEYDPRDPKYDPQYLLVVIGVTAAQISDELPAFFTH